MSFFQRSYKDTLRVLKAETEKKEKIEENKNSYDIVPNTINFAPYIYDISNISLDPFDSNLFYKKSYRRAYEYEFPFDGVKQNKRRQNFYKHIQEYLTNIIKERLVNEDYLSGYFITKEMLSIKTKKIKIFMAGLTKDSILHGIMDASITKNISVDYIGCDRVMSKIYRYKYYNGVSKKCNVHDIDSAVSINIELGEKISIKSIDLFIVDIKAATTCDVLCSYIIQYTFMSKNGTIILRLPDSWNKIYTSMVTLLIFFISQYKSVRIFKTPWGNIPKVYILLYGLKEEITQAKKMSLISYAKELKNQPNLPLYKNIVFETEFDEKENLSNMDKETEYNDSEEKDFDHRSDTEENVEYATEEINEAENTIEDTETTEENTTYVKDKSVMELLLDNIYNTYKQIRIYDEKYTEDQIHDIWIELLK